MSEQRHKLPQFEESQGWLPRLVGNAVGITLVALAVLVMISVGVLFAFSFDITVSASGHLEPETIWPAYAPQTGVLKEILVAPGDEVNEGQVLASLDGFELSRDLERLRLELRYKRSSGSSPRAEVELLRQRIATVEEQLRRLNVYAPADGVVLTEELHRLDGALVAEGELLFEIGSKSEWKAVLSVSEGDIHRIRLGDPVKTKVPAFASLQGWLTEGFKGHVAFVGGEPLDEASLRGAYRVKASLDLSELPPRDLSRFRRGMLAESQVITRSGRGIDLLMGYLKEAFYGP